MTREQLIAEIPGGQGWWNYGSKQEFIKIGNELGSAGLKTKQIVDVLTRAYHAVSNEYGD